MKKDFFMIVVKPTVNEQNQPFYRLVKNTIFRKSISCSHGKYVCLFLNAGNKNTPFYKAREIAQNEVQRYEIASNEPAILNQVALTIENGCISDMSPVYRVIESMYHELDLHVCPANDRLDPSYRRRFKQQQEFYRATGKFLTPALQEKLKEESRDAKMDEMVRLHLKRKTPETTETPTDTESATENNTIPVSPVSEKEEQEVIGEIISTVALSEDLTVEQDEDPWEWIAISKKNGYKQYTFF